MMTKSMITVHCHCRWSYGFLTCSQCSIFGNLYQVYFKSLEQSVSKRGAPPRLDGELKIHFLSALIFYAFECPNHKTCFGFPLLCKITKIKNFVASGAIKISITRSKWKSYNAYAMLSCNALSNILHIISYSKCTTRFSVTIKLAILLFKSYHNIFSLKFIIIAIAWHTKKNKQIEVLLFP